MKIRLLILFIGISFTFQSCGIYSFTGTNIDAKTVQVDYFPNNATLVEPTLSSEFTNALQDKFVRQTNLSLVPSGGELQFEGEITNYTINPTSATAEQTAAMNRLTITIKVRFYNSLNEADNFEKSFSHYYDYGANVQLSGGTLEDAYTEIFERITQDIFNESVAKW
jgi:hypothetical protein